MPPNCTPEDFEQEEQAVQDPQEQVGQRKKRPRKKPAAKTAETKATRK